MESPMACISSVSYTHLDVYKRQRIQYAPDYRNSISKLREMQVTNLLGQQVPLIAVADIQEKEGPVQIERLTQQRYVKVTTNLNGISLGDGAKKDVYKRQSMGCVWSGI